MVTKSILAELHERCWQTHSSNQTWASMPFPGLMLSPGPRHRLALLLYPEEPLGIFAKNSSLLGKRHIGTLAGFMDHLLGGHEIHFMRVVGGI